MHINRVYGLAESSASDLDQGDEIASVDEVVVELGKREAIARAEADQANAELDELREQPAREKARRVTEAWAKGEPSELSGPDLSESDGPETIDLANAETRREVDEARAVAEIWRRERNR